MSLPEELLKQANNYLENTLSDEERSDFELELAQNKELQEYLSISKEMDKQYSDTDWQFLESTNTKEVDALEDYLKSDETKALRSAINNASITFKKNEKKPKTFNLKKYSFLAVAALVILFLGLNFFGSNNNLYQDYNSWEELPSLINRGEVQENILQNAEAAFLNKEYSKANNLYKQYIDTTKEFNVTAYLYLGITDLELNNEAQALSSFNKIIESNSLDASKGHWYKALTYLKFEKNDLAIEQLELIVENSDNYNFSEAQLLLNKLK